MGWLDAVSERELVLDDERRGRVVGQLVVRSRGVVDLVGAWCRGRPRRLGDDAVDLDDDALGLSRHAGRTALEAVLGCAGRRVGRHLALAVDSREGRVALVGTRTAISPGHPELHLAAAQRARARVDGEGSSGLAADELGSVEEVGVGHLVDHGDLHVALGPHAFGLTVEERASDHGVTVDACGDGGLGEDPRVGGGGASDDERGSCDDGDDERCDGTRQRPPSLLATAKGVWALLLVTEH